MKIHSLITIALVASLLLGCTGGTKKSDGTRESGDVRESVMTLTAAKEVGEAVALVTDADEADGGDIWIEPRIVMNTRKTPGERVAMWVAADGADRPDVWIDLNNNGVREAGEGFETIDRKSGRKETFVVESQTITVYGKVTFFSCNESDITSLTVRKGEKLNELWCEKNPLSSVTLAEVPMLKDLWLRGNRLTEREISNIVASLPEREPSDYAMAFFDDNPDRVTKQDSAIAAAKNWSVKPVKLSPEAQARYDALLKEWEPFLGEWCCNDETVNVGEYFKLTFNLSDHGLSIIFHSGGPFEEEYSGKVVSENRAELYFSSVGGSISFNRLMDEEEMEEKIGKKVADCVLQPDGTLKVLILEGENDTVHATHTLRAIKEGEWCELRQD